MPRYKQMPMPPGQNMLFGTSVEEALPADSDVQAFRDVMDCLDYSGLLRKCSRTGRPAYDPVVLVKVLGYAYSKGMRSSRRIEELLKVDVRYIWLAGGYKPDHNTLARFRKDNWKELGLLFKDSVRLCCAAGLAYLNVVATDGSKIAAAASDRRIYNKAKLERAMARVERILKEAEEVDKAEDGQEGIATDSEMPDELKNAATRKAKLEQIAKRLKETDRTSVVETEADARVMVTDGDKLPCYNLQASVDAENQVIVAMKLIQSENDVGMLPEMVEETESNTGLSPDLSLTDGGYANEETLKWLDETGHDALMPIKSQPQESSRNDLFCSRCFWADDKEDVLICPAGRKLLFKRIYKTGGGHYKEHVATGCKSCSFQQQCVGKGKSSRRIRVSVVAKQREAMRESLNSAHGQELYALRQQIVEPVFGQTKWNRGLDRFLCWGLNGATAEASIACLVHNVMKCVRNSRARAYITAAISAYIRWLSVMVVCLRISVSLRQTFGRIYTAPQAEF